MDLLRDAIGPFTRAGSVPVFLRKPMATCDFTWGVRTPFPICTRPCNTNYSTSGQTNVFVVLQHDCLIFRIASNHVKS